MIQILVIGLSLFLASCNGAEKPKEPQVNTGSTDTTTQVKTNPKPLKSKQIAEKRFVYARSGLNLRKGPNLKDEKIETIPFGAELELLESSNEDLTIDGLQGKMVKVRYKDQEGYMFEGYLSKFPAPKPEMKVKEFISLIKSKGLNPIYQKERFDDGGYIQDTEGLTLPTEDWQEAFLIAKTFFGIPEKINFPAGKTGEETIVENPDKEEYIWSDELVVKRETDGKTIKEMYYYHRGEGGGRTLAIEKAENGGLNVLEILIAD